MLGGILVIVIIVYILSYFGIGIYNTLRGQLDMGAMTGFVVCFFALYGLVSLVLDILRIL